MPAEGPPFAEETRRSVRPLAIAVVALVAAVVRAVPFPGLEPNAHMTLVVLVAAAGLWMSEALPVAVTALLVPVLAIVLGAADAKRAFAGFADPIVFLFLGTFFLTTAAFEYGLNARLARRVLRAPAVRREPSRLLWAVALLGCGVSAWVNNTATTALILPLALTAEGRVPRPLLVGILLMSAYAPSLGGLATPVGTAPNLIGLRLLEAGTGQHLSFARWCVAFAPLALLMTALTAGYFRLRTRRAAIRDVAPAASREETAGAASADEQPAGPWSRAEKTLVGLFALVVLLWVTPGVLQATHLREASWMKLWAARLPETSVPLLGALLLFVLPSGRPGRPILTIDVLQRVDWSTLLLFGGGLALGSLMLESGLARHVGEAIFAVTPFRGVLGIVLAATVMGVLISELTSNTASASLVVPVVLALAQAAGVDPLKPALAATVACSFGFMLPVSTPPNALVFATGRVRLGEMVRYGVLLDLLGIAVVTAWVTWLL